VSGKQPPPKVAAKKPAPPPPEPEPEVLEEVEAEPEPLEEEALLDEDDVPEIKGPKPIDADPALISEDSLYSDEDPLEKLREARKLAGAKPKPAAPPAKVSAKVPAAKAGSNKMPAAAKPTAAKGSNAKMAPASKTSQKKAAPPPETEAEPEEEFAEEIPEVEAEPREVAEVETAEPEAEAEDESPKANKGSRQQLKATKPSIKTGRTTTRRLKEEEEEGAGEPSARNSRRTTKRSMRTGAVKGMSKKTRIMLIAAAVLIAAGAVAYKPVMKSLHIRSLDNPENSVESRKAAVDKLFHNYKTDAFGVFQAPERLGSDQPALREAAAYGIELLAKARLNKTSPTARLIEEMPKADKDGKIMFVHTLGNIANTLTELKERNEDDNENIKQIAQALIERSEPAEAELPVRLASVEVLGKLRTPGVCIQLLKLARSEKGELGEKSKRGIAYTALPDKTVGELLKAMTAQDVEKDLADVAKQAFVTVRDGAKSDDLVPLVGDPSDDVRREIVDALGKRKGDSKAAEGVTRALSDKLPEIRAMAVKAIPTTTLHGPVTQLSKLVTDSDENVRVANAETLAQLRDYESLVVILDAFKQNLEGKTLTAYIKALGKRSSGKDLKSCKILIDLLDGNPGAEKSLREALVAVTLNNQPSREATRKSWSAARWKEWFANITKREKIKEEALGKLQAADLRKQEDKKFYAELAKMTNEGLEMLDQCKEMSRADDPEDMDLFDQKIKKYSANKYLFFKGQSIDARGGD
jgi:HEAT repeat protein